MPSVTSGDSSISFTAAGVGPLLILVAGTGYPQATWPPAFVRPLTERYTVVTYDQRGTGESPGTEGPYSTRLFATDAAVVIEAVGGPAVVLGHSMGGRVAQWLARDRPELVNRLILAASGPGISADSNQGQCGIPIRTVLSLVEHGYEWFIRDLQRRTFFTPEFVESAPEAVRWLGDAFWGQRPSLEDYLKHVIARQTHDAVSVLDDIKQPTLVVVGEHDTHQGDTGSHMEQAEYLAAHLPRAELMVLPGVTHGFFWQDPDLALNALGGWLEEPGS